MANEDAIYIGELAMPMIKGEKGDKGDQGPQGEQGIQGIAGVNATIAVGSTVTGAAGTEASVENSGTASNAVLNFVVPRGDKGEKGDTGEIVSVSATTLSSTSQAYARNNGTTTDAELELGIPKGVGISNVTIDEHYNVMVTLEDNTQINAGSLSELDAVNTYIQGATNVTMIYPWDANNEYYRGDTVLHNNHFCMCRVDTATQGTYVQNEWDEWDILNLLQSLIANNNAFASQMETVGTIITNVLPTTYEAKSNKVTSISSSSTDTQYPSAKAVYDATKDSITSVDYATSSVGGVFKLGNYIELDSNKRLCQTVHLSTTGLKTEMYDDVLLSADNVKSLIHAFRKTTIDPNESYSDRTTNFPTTGAVVDYVASVVGDINSALDAINGEEV